MNYIVIDLEWNQPIVPKKRIKGFHGDIVQIGAVKADDELNIIDECNIIVKPMFYTKMNSDVTKLTGITQEMIEKSDTNFKAAMDKLREWIGDEESVLITWGLSDMDMIVNNSQKYEVDMSWMPDCYDAQLMFDDQEMQENRSFALNYALYHFDERPESSHDALDDAKSTLKILRHLDIEDGKDEYFMWRPLND